MDSLAAEMLPAAPTRVEGVSMEWAWNLAERALGLLQAVGVVCRALEQMGALAPRGALSAARWLPRRL